MMVQLFAALISSLLVVAALGAIALMLHGEWRRIVAILSGRELAGALASAPKVRVRVRAWKTPALRQAPRLRAAA